MLLKYAAFLCFKTEIICLQNYQNKLPADGSAPTKKRGASPHSQDISFGLKSQYWPTAQRQANTDMQKRQRHILRHQVKLTAPAHYSKRPTISRKEKIDTISECYRLAQKKLEIRTYPLRAPCEKEKKNCY